MTEGTPATRHVLLRPKWDLEMHHVAAGPRAEQSTLRLHKRPESELPTGVRNHGSFPRKFAGLSQHMAAMAATAALSDGGQPICRPCIGKQAQVCRLCIKAESISLHISDGTHYCLSTDIKTHRRLYLASDCQLKTTRHLPTYIPNTSNSVPKGSWRRREACTIGMCLRTDHLHARLCLPDISARQRRAEEDFDMQFWPPYP